MNVEIICPLYNAENYIRNLNQAILNQKNISIKKISYVMTIGKDRTEDILKELGCEYSKIQPKDFSHSLTREKIAMKSNADILVFISQDIEIRNDDWLEKLIKPIENGEAQACFSRQLTKYNNIEKYTREKNYPEKSYIVSKADVDEMGLKAFFFSDASSAIKAEVFKKLNGYDGKDFASNEDQYIAHKIIMSGYKIKYCADSIVYHSHNFSLKEMYKRYYATGLFYGQEKHMNNYGTNKTGGGLAKYILRRAIQDRNWKVLIRFVPDMGARYIGMKQGYRCGKH